MSNRLRSLYAAINLAQGPLQAFLEEVAGAVGFSVNLSNAPPQNVGVTSPGVGPDASRADHVHAHGDQAGDSLHALASPNPGGPAGSCRLDGNSNFWFKANGATLNGGATKTIQDDLVP